VSELEEEIAEEMGEDAGVPDGIDPETGEIIEQSGEPEAAAEVAPAPRSQKEIDEVQDKLKAEAKRHSNAVAKIMGEDFGFLVPNPTDWTPGFIFNVPEMHPAPEALHELHALLRAPEQIELRPATDAEACPDCNALGEVLTGSKKPGQETKPCPGCGGTGWKPKLAVAPTQTQVYDFTGNGGTQGGAPNQIQVADRFGRPFGHPHYGLDPAQVGV